MQQLNFNQPESYFDDASPLNFYRGGTETNDDDLVSEGLKWSEKMFTKTSNKSFKGKRSSSK